MRLEFVVPSKHFIDALNKFKPAGCRGLTLEDFSCPKVIRVLTDYVRTVTADELFITLQTNEGAVIAKRFFRAAFIY